jgi:quinol monooxygenase YgiN
MVRYVIRPEKLWEAQEAIKALVAEVREKEPGVLFYEAYQQPRSFIFVHFMTFANSDAEEAHRNSDHLKQFMSTIYPICSEVPVFSELKLIAGKKGAAQ